MDCGLYVHVPFCAKRCPYCAFVLIESDGSLHAKFVDRVIREIRAARRPGRTLFFGGGTPSLLQSTEVARIVEACGPVEGEITLEANPDDSAKFAAFRDAGINRLSIGIQSIHDDELKFLGRTHDAAQAKRAYAAARAAFENVSVDIIFGLPGQTLDRWRATLDEVLSWDVPHISLYGLTYEKGTAFERADFKRLGDDDEAAMYELAMDKLAGYHHYEISNFAKPGFESEHNRGYWDGRPYLGFGPGAHSYVPHARWWNISNVREYLERDDVVASREELNVEQRMLERVFLGLRQDAGVDLLKFQEEFGVGFLTRYRPQVAEFEAGGLLRVEEGRVRLTRAGRLLADRVTARFA